MHDSVEDKCVSRYIDAVAACEVNFNWFWCHWTLT